MNGLFKSLDEEEDGLISYVMLEKALKGLNLDERASREAMQTIDIDNSGLIKYSEFLAVFMDRDLMLKTEKLEDAFNHFDTVKGK